MGGEWSAFQAHDEFSRSRHLTAGALSLSRAAIRNTDDGAGIFCSRGSTIALQINKRYIFDKNCTVRLADVNACPMRYGDRMETMDTSLSAGEGDEVNLRPRQVALLADLEQFFFVNGYRSVTMGLLAEQMKCSKRSLYELAPNRRELFILIVGRWVRRIQKAGHEAAAAQSDPRRRLAAFLEPGVRETIGVGAAFLADLRDLPTARAILDRHQQQRMAELQTILDEGSQSGAFKNLHGYLVAGVYLAAIEKMNEPEFLARAGLSFSEAFAELYRLLMTGLETGEDIAPSR